MAGGGYAKFMHAELRIRNAQRIPETKEASNHMHRTNSRWNLPQGKSLAAMFDWPVFDKLPYAFLLVWKAI